MIKCSDCGTRQYEGTLFCSECGNLLAPGDTETTAILPFSDLTTRVPPPPLETKTLQPATAPLAITIVIPGSRRIQLTVKDEIQIGRADPSASFAPALDLTQDDGARKGVSRRHAAIRAYKQGLALIDLGSTNGTLLNGNRLVPERPYPIRSGDEIRFGDLLIHLFVE